ncbi:MAG TPA: TonB-dependent receptor [Acidobacteriaceae bacterium]|nr:TonB-dependent receptor [Acidobacteriaceae bacterium]
MQRLTQLLAVIFLLSTCFSFAQIADQHYAGQVLDPAGRPVPHAMLQVQIGNRTLQAVTDSSGTFDIATPLTGPAIVSIRIAGYAPFQQKISAAHSVPLQLAAPSNVQRVVVTASRTALALDQSANTVRVVSQKNLERNATITVGDRLRQVPGLQFFRRSSTLVANPTSQGVSLRGLGSTAASRTLVMADGIPVNDPFGGWIYWDQLPSLAIQDIEVVRGGVSDLYGSSAIGGVINMIERKPEHTVYALDTGYAQENTPHASLLATRVYGPWSELLAGDFLRTDGYIEVAPQFRGTVDTSANVHYENGELDLRRTITERGIAYLRGNVLNEARGNGTPLQTNGTRLWRYATGIDWTSETAGIFTLKAFGDQEHYRQTFSAVASNQNSEFLTRRQQVPTQQIGGAAQWSKTLRPWLTLIAGGDLDDIRATDYEVPIHNGLPNGLSDTSARQRATGGYAEGLLQWKNWTATASLRIDNFLNFDASEFLQTGHGPIVPKSIPNRSETLADPKVGVVHRINDHFALTGSAYRAFRSATLNELYRRGQVGQEVTLANPNLQSEKATGWESGVELALPSRNTVVRASYFWTEVNRPIIALTLNVTPSQVLNKRENLGQIRSRGFSLDYQSEPLHWLYVTGGYQYADATVTQFAQEPSLVGKWIPQVAHNMATTQVRATRNRLGTLELLGTLSGRQYDDDANRFLLNGYFQLDGYIAHSFGPRMEVYGGVTNMLNRAIDVGRTPILTLGTPRMASVGIRVHSRGFARQH